jgi:sialate O-acetylesterase
MKLTIRRMSAVLCLLIAAPSIHAETAALEIPTIFSDGMVLQRDMPVPVWGRAQAGARVTVRFANQAVDATADASGAWIARLAPLAASAAPAELAVESGDASRVIRDVLVGEVWLCSGQSNMVWTMGNSLDGDLDALGATNPLIRLYQVDMTPAAEPRFSAKAAWSHSTPATVPGFSAVAYHFGKALQPALGVPVGLIQSAWGGTPAISWTRSSAFPQHPQLMERHQAWEEGVAKFPAQLEEWKKAMEEWKKANGIAPGTQINPQQHPNAPKFAGYDPTSQHRPGSLANGMIAPVAPSALRGVIWYQGESDATKPTRYDEHIAVLFNDWRKWFENPSMPVGIVQLASFMPVKSEPSDDPWPHLRESQRRFVRKDPHAGLAVAIDIGETDDIHPTDKTTVGRRLARWALADVYGKLTLRGGPELDAADFTDGGVKLTFSQTGSGLRAFNGPPLLGFTLAGADGVFHPANAKITGKDSLVVRSKAVPDPVHVRYAWQNNPASANLRNQERLPASPFEIAKP